MRCVLPGHRALSALLRSRRAQRCLSEGMVAMPRSSGSRYYSPFPVRVGIVCDEFVFQSFRDTCSLCRISPESTEETLGSLDLFLVVSTWHGPDHVWDGAGSQDSPNNRRLREMMRTCRRDGVPVVFYSKEDPPNFAYFLNLAAEADTIFTSAIEMVEEYRARFPGVGVYPLAFGVNPRLYHPIGLRRDGGRETAVFAGSWITKYPERIRDQKRFFSWLRRAGLALRIVDRNDSRNLLHYRYPIRYQRFVLPDIPYEELSSVYKLHTWVVNFNSVTDSSTMFAMRVYDALACGSLILSNESTGMEKLFPEVFVLRQREDLSAALRMGEQERWLRRVASVRHILSGNTAYDRLAELLTKSGIAVSVPVCRVGILLEPGSRDSGVLRGMFEAQTYERKQLIRWPEEAALAEDCEVLTVWKEGRSYGPHYLEDMVNGFKYTACDYVTKGCDVEYCYVSEITDKYGTGFWQSEIPAAEIMAMPERCQRANGFAADRLNYSRSE